MIRGPFLLGPQAGGMVRRPLYHLKVLIPAKNMIWIFGPTSAWVTDLRRDDFYVKNFYR